MHHADELQQHALRYLHNPPKGDIGRMQWLETKKFITRKALIGLLQLPKGEVAIARGMNAEQLVRNYREQLKSAFHTIETVIRDFAAGTHSDCLKKSRSDKEAATSTDLFVGNISADMSRTDYLVEAYKTGKACQVFAVLSCLPSTHDVWKAKARDSDPKGAL
jgi:hypothetical protein